MRPQKQNTCLKLRLSKSSFHSALWNYIAILKEKIRYINTHLWLAAHSVKLIIYVLTFFKALYTISTSEITYNSTCILFTSHCTTFNTYCLFNLTGKNMNLELLCSTAAFSKCKTVTFWSSILSTHTKQHLIDGKWGYLCVAWLIYYSVKERKKGESKKKVNKTNMPT